MKTNLFRKLTTAILSLLMFCQVSPGWATVYGGYDTNTRTLKFSGSGEITQNIVRNISNYLDATQIQITGNVYGIAQNAFDGTNLTSVVIPSSINTIGANAFSGCSKLQSVTFESGTTTLTIGKNAFTNETTTTSGSLVFFWNRPFTYAYDYQSPIPGAHSPFFKSRLSKVVIGPNVSKVYFHSFYACANLATVDMTNATDLGSIEKEAFANCVSLQSVEIPIDVKQIKEAAFSGCNNLNSVRILGLPTLGPNAFPTNAVITDCSALTYEEWLNAYKNKSAVTELIIPNNEVAMHEYSRTNNLNNLFPNVTKVIFAKAVDELDACIFCVPDGYPSNKLTTVEINNADGVYVGAEAFYNNQELSSISDTRIWYCQSSCFKKCTSLTSVSLTQCEYILDNAFAGCSSLETVKVSSLLKYIEQTSFANCPNLKNLHVPALDHLEMSFTETENLGTVFGPNLEHVSFLSGVTTIKARSFQGCTSLKSVSFGSGTKVESIGDYAFQHTGLESLSLTSSIRTIGKSAFANTPMTSISIPRTITTIGESAFEYNNFETVTFERGSDVLTIGLYAFAPARNIEKPVTFYCYREFSYTPNYTLATNLTKYSKSMFHVYESLNNWPKTYSYLTNVVLGSGLKKIPEHAFEGCFNLSSIEIPSSVETIGTYAFGNCSALQSAIISDGVKTIERNAFEHCSLTSLSLSNTLTNIGTAAFWDCTTLPTVTIPASVQSIEQLAFRDCSSLKTALLLSSETQYPNNAFPSSTNVYKGPDAVYIGWLSSYEDKGSVTDLTIPDDIIANHAFSETDNLATLFPNVKKVVFGSTVTSIGQNIFNGASNLETVEFKSEVTVGERAFRNCDKLASINEDKITQCLSYSFYGCSSLTTLNLAVCSKIDMSAFSMSSGLTEVRVSTPLNYLALNSFAGCTNLKTLYIDSPIILETYTDKTYSLIYRFGDKVENVFVGDNVTTIGQLVFAGTGEKKN